MRSRQLHCEGVVTGSFEIPQQFFLKDCRRAHCLMLCPRKRPQGKTEASWGLLAVGQACDLEASRISEAAQSTEVFLAEEKQEVHTSRICLKYCDE